jgi:hypothetical protein
MTNPLAFRRLVLPILALFAISAAIRWSWRKEPIVGNIEASYHVLLTVEAMDQTPVSVHRFLPIVTLGREQDRDVQFGSSVRGPGGIYYYTSFPPLGFVAPWAFFKVTRLSPSIEHLMLFNLGIHLAATLLLALLVYEGVREMEIDPATHGWIVVLSAATYLFTFESLYSHGIIYWHHSLFQVVWLTQLIVAARVFRAAERGDPLRRADVVTLLVASALGPAVEWTGYLASASIAVLCLWRGRRIQRRELGRVGAGIIVATAIAGIAFVAHFTWVIGLDPLIAALRARAGARSTAHASLTQLAAGYRESFGLLLGFGAATIAFYAIAIRRRPPAWAVALWVVAAFPLRDNLVLAEHATVYHYDRLKALVPLVGSLAGAIALMPGAIQRRAVVVWLAVLGWTVSGMTSSRKIGVAPPLATNDSLMVRVRSRARPCALFATNAMPRGWVELTVGGNTFEGVPDVDSLQQLVASRRACQGLYFETGRAPGEEMYVWQRAMIFDPGSGSVDTLDWSAPKKFRRLPERKRNPVVAATR